MNHTRAVFRAGARRITAESGLVQYDYGQILDIEGIELPGVFEADFGNEPVKGKTKTQIGTDGSVRIPKEYLESGEPIYVFIFLHEGENDGSTEYRIMIPVEKRSERTEEEPEEEEASLIGQTISALNAAAERAEEEADAAEAAKESILNLSVSAQTLEPGSEASVTKEVDEETGEVSLRFGIPYGPQGKKGDKGDPGTVFTPSVSASGVLSWTNNGELESPASFDVVAAVLNALPTAEEGRF